MATKEEETDSENLTANEGGSWWQSWGKTLVDTVKEKTSSTYEMVQKDLSEFYQTIQTDTAHVVADTATKVQDQIKAANNEGGSDGSKESSSFKQGFASILTTVSESLKTLAQEESPLTSKTEGESPAASPVYDRRQAKIHQIQTDVGTYCNEPEGPSQDFEEWKKSFDFDAKRTEMSELLVKLPEIRAIYSRLVPSVISHATFWQRYFYKINQFELGEERRAALVARAETSSLHEEELNWDSDDGDDIDETMLTEKAANAETTIREKTEIETTEVDSVTVKQCSEIGEIHSEGTKASAEFSKGDAVSEESKDEHSFEILSPEKCKQEEKESDCSDKSEKTGDRRLTEGGLRSSSSDHSSPGKEDSSSNSSVEVIQKSSDNVTRLLPHVNTEDNGERVHLRNLEETRADHSETASTGSWISVDDELRVRRSKHEKFINDKESDVDPFKSPASNRNSDSSSSSAVLVEKTDCKALEDDDDVDIDLDEDINEEELKKIMEKIKSKSGDLDDDNDWEDWE